MISFAWFIFSNNIINDASEKKTFPFLLVLLEPTVNKAPKISQI